MKRQHRNVFHNTRGILSSITNNQIDRTHSSLIHKNKVPFEPVLTDQAENIPPHRLHPNPVLAAIDQEALNFNHEVLLPQRKETEHLEQLRRSKENEELFKNTIKNKFLKANKRGSCQSVDTKGMIPDFGRVSTINSSCAKGSESSFQNQREEMNQWLKRTKAVLRESNSSCGSKQKIRLKNLDKFNVDFVEYLKKKSYRRIEKDKINRIISRKENIVEMYQEHLIKSSGLGVRSKQGMRKCFDILNVERKSRG